jgi:hypothetical protein
MKPKINLMTRVVFMKMDYIEIFLEIIQTIEWVNLGLELRRKFFPPGQCRDIHTSAKPHTIVKSN